MESKQEEKPTIELVCYGCGEPLNGQNSKAVSAERHVFERVPYCIKCQQNTFSLLSRRCGSRTMAMWLCCLFYDIPYNKEVVESTVATRYGVWQTYLVNLRQAKKNRIGDKPTTFMDGISDMSIALGADMPSVPADGDSYGMTDRERWNEEWGAEQSDTECAELDRIYNQYTAGRMTISDQAEMTYRRVTKWTREVDKLMRRPDKEAVSNAKNISSMIDTALASEQLRKKDELPQESMRIDSIADALERSGYLRDGKILDYNDLIKHIKNDNPKFPYTKDVADQMILIMRNCTMANEGGSEIPYLPEKYAIADVNGEFAKTEDDREKRTKSKLDIIGSAVEPKKKKTR